MWWAIVSIWFLWFSHRGMMVECVSPISPISPISATGLPAQCHRVWECIKRRNLLYDNETFLIHRPFSEMPMDAVSEGVGYGLLVALYEDDREGFDRLLEGAERTMWNGKWYDWRVDPHHEKIGFGAASDAEQDIAAALILADRKWACPSCRERAQQMLDSMWENGMIDMSSGYVLPGYHWGGDAFLNPSYFAPAWYRLYQEFDAHKDRHDWQWVIDTSYNVLLKSPGAQYGLVPDWMTADGNFVSGSDMGYNAYGDGRYMFKDGIRVLWRIGTDLLWNPHESRASSVMTNAYHFIGTIARANFYQMNGSLVPAEDSWTFDGGLKTRPRREHSPLTIGMWLIPFFLHGTPEERSECTRTLESYYTDKDDCYWGLDTDALETIDHNELYFDQFLAQFGALFASGRWTVTTK